jgi:hypothetical protein
VTLAISVTGNFEITIFPPPLPLDLGEKQLYRDLMSLRYTWYVFSLLVELQ